MPNVEFEEKFRHIIKKMGEYGEAYSEAKKQSWYAQELKGSILASIIIKQGDIAVSRAEIIAKGSDDYKQYLLETAEAIKKELQLKAKYEMYKASFEALRSMSSLEKATQNQIGV